ncbi:MAG: DUF454 domain-containing protein [Ignavibacteriae bacterium]|nr:MAG: DUF454 domain-containing protein [Ignavibacteriota bacterium]
MLINTAGFICVGLGVIGIFLPLIPATDFFLLAAACFAISSPKFYHWLLYNRFFGKYIRNYRENRGMTLLTKIWTLLFLWATISYSIYIIDNIYVRILLAFIAIGVTVHVLMLKRAK